MNGKEQQAKRLYNYVLSYRQLKAGIYKYMYMYYRPLYIFYLEYTNI